MNEDTTSQVLRPPLLMSAEDHSRLSGLAAAITRSNPLVGRLLTEETDRADVVPDGEVPARTVVLGSVVDYHDATNGEQRRVSVVLPPDADFAEGRISILSLVGAGLIGLSEGQSIDWPAGDGRLRRLTVLRVTPPET